MKVNNQNIIGLRIAVAYILRELYKNHKIYVEAFISNDDCIKCLKDFLQDKELVTTKSKADDKEILTTNFFIYGKNEHNIKFHIDKVRSKRQTLVSFSDKPLQLVAQTGLVLSAFSFAIGLVYLLFYIFY